MIFSGHQPNFLPYMGVFYKMFQADIFVLDDDVQYSTKGLHNKNYIAVNGKRTAIHVPVIHKFGDKINDVTMLHQGNWQRKMLRCLELNYKKTPHFDEVFQFISEHINSGYEKLCEMNIAIIKEIAERMLINCKIVIASKDVPTELIKKRKKPLPMHSIRMQYLLFGSRR